MNCETCQTELADLLDDETTVARAQSLRAHLSSCAECAALWHTLTTERALFAQFAEQTALEPTPELWRGIAARIAAEPVAPSAAPTIAFKKMLFPTKPHEDFTKRNFSNVKAFVSSSCGFVGEILFLKGYSSMAARWKDWCTAWLTPLVLRQLAGATALVVLSVAATTLYFKSQTPANLALTKPEQPPTPSATATSEPAQASPTPALVRQPIETASTDATKTGPQLTEPRPVLTRFKATTAAANTTGASATVGEQQLIRQQLARAEREYQTAIRLLDRVIARQRDKLAPALIAQYESSLELIDQSIAQSRRALRENTQDAATGQFLLASYAKKLELLQDIAMQTGQ